MYENGGVSALNAELDMLTSMLEQKRNDNAFNYNYWICDLCGGCHTIYKCIQVQNMDYYDELGHYYSCFDQCNPCWVNSYEYGLNNQGAYGNSSCSYDYQPKCVHMNLNHHEN